MNDEAEVMEPEVEVNPMQTFVDDILQKNFAGAQSTFNDLLGDKLNDALDAEKVALAQQVYNGAEPPDEEQMELDLEDGDEEYAAEYFADSVGDDVDDDEENDDEGGRS